MLPMVYGLARSALTDGLWVRRVGHSEFGSPWKGDFSFYLDPTRSAVGVLVAAVAAAAMAERIEVVLTDSNQRN